MAKALSPAAKREADALLLTLKMAERHHKWDLMSQVLAFIREAGWRFVYLSPGTYALRTPQPTKENTK